jgi:pyridoxamine 5'-phosphate oxidase
MTPRPHAEPFDRFRSLLADAAALDRVVLPEPTAFALGTVSADGQPAVRMLLLKAVEDVGFVFYTNYESRKGRELLANPKAAMCFHWMPFEMQVRIEGTVEQVSDADADAYYASRPRGSRIGAWASAQSRPIEQEGDLERRVAEITARFGEGDIPRPPHWSGFRLVPHRIEFWKGQPSRLHRREVYRRDEGGWRVEILYP